MFLPEDFTAYTRQLMGDGLYKTLADGLSAVSPTSIRLNPYKLRGGEGGIHGADGKVGWCEYGYYLAKRPNFTFDPLLHAGLYYVQEASSMFLYHVLRQLVHAPAVVLDLCAAPGGKSTVARTALPEDSLLIANEPIRQRSQILSENLQKFGHPRVIVTNNYPKDFRKAAIGFDVVIADVPCSGEGMFRKDDGAISEWNAKNVDNCRRLQRQIIEDVWPCLKPGGLLIYSTCTFNAHENEENTQWIARELGAEPIEIAVEKDWNITGPLVGDSPVYRFLPGRSRGEGLFMCAMRKLNGDTIATKRKDRPGKGCVPNAKCGDWLNAPQRFGLVSAADKIIAVPHEMEDLYQKAAERLRIMHAGITLGTVKGSDIVPSQALALAIDLNREAFPRHELDYRQAMAYLSKAAITLSADTPRGYVIVTYKNAPLGFVKNIGNRANNLYPQEWRVKSTHIPDQEQNIIEL